MKEVVAYRNSLDVRTDKDLIIALDRVVDVVQNHLYHAYLGEYPSFCIDLYQPSAYWERVASLNSCLP